MEQSGESPGLYVHVPFCKTKCPYCDFYSVTDLSLIEEWLSGILQEIEFYKDTFNTFDTLYLGGGTPTVLSNAVLTGLFQKLRRKFNFKDNAEITVEANPDDVTLEKLELLKALGVNRLSIGVQSFNDEELTFLKRRHSLKGAEEALSRVKEVGFKNFGIDLIYGLPGQTVASWMASLEKALTFKPAHLSCYQLTPEKSTTFGKMKDQGKFKVCSEKKGRGFFLTTSKFLEQNGFVHYEISNFSRGKKFRSRHNCKYWNHIPYLGLGPGAHSFQGRTRWWNVKSVKDYCDKINTRLRPTAGSESLSNEQLRLEKLFLGLRTCDGVALNVAFPESPFNDLLRNVEKTRLVSVRENRLIPTKKGFLMADHLPLLFP